jgi:hypothetical protein
MSVVSAPTHAHKLTKHEAPHAGVYDNVTGIPNTPLLSVESHWRTPALNPPHAGTAAGVDRARTRALATAEKAASGVSLRICVLGRRRHMSDRVAGLCAAGGEAYPFASPFAPQMTLISDARTVGARPEPPLSHGGCAGGRGGCIRKRRGPWPWRPCKAGFCCAALMVKPILASMQVLQTCAKLRHCAPPWSPLHCSHAHRLCGAFPHALNRSHTVQIAFWWTLFSPRETLAKDSSLGAAMQACWGRPIEIPGRAAALVAWPARVRRAPASHLVADFARGAPNGVCIRERSSQFHPARPPLPLGQTAELRAL